MKKLLLFLVIVFFSLQNSFSQIAVFDTVVATILETSKLERVAHYAQMVENSITQIQHLKNQVEHAANTVKMTAQNLQSLQDVNNWDDFMDWYNRQLYYERMSIETVKGMNVNIGKKNYSIYDLEGMAEGFDDTYVKYWDKEFTEEQR